MLMAHAAAVTLHGRSTAGLTLAWIISLGSIMGSVRAHGLPVTAAAPQAGPVRAATHRQACDWRHPGHRPYTGELATAVDAYRDIPATVRGRLKLRIAAAQYDELVTITRQRIQGRATYQGEIRDMHWAGGVCRGVVDRSAWAPGAIERGLVYCEAGHCILVPTVCRNVARVQRIGTVAPAATPRAAAEGPLDIAPSAGWIAHADPWRYSPALLPITGPLEPQAHALRAAPLLASAGRRDDAVLVGQAPATWASQALLTAPASALTLPAPIPPVPEPGSWTTMAVGLLAVLAITRAPATRSRAGSSLGT